MKKLVLLLSVMFIVACGEEEKTVYDYLINKPLLDQVLNDCISGKERDQYKCNVVKQANNNYQFFKKGLISEDRLKRLGKK